MKQQPKITDFLDPAKERGVFVQGRIPESLYDQLKRELERSNLSWSKYLTATGKQFLAEMQGARKKTSQ